MENLGSEGPLKERQTVLAAGAWAVTREQTQGRWVMRPLNDEEDGARDFAICQICGMPD